MCTPAEAETACENALKRKDKNGKTVIERALESEGNAIVKTLTVRFGWSVVVLAITASVGWYNLVYRVSNLEERMAEGGRYTKEQSIEDKAKQSERDKAQDARIAELKLDVSDGFRQVDKKLDTIQNLLYQLARNR
jgi:hypothetical protein